MLLGTLGIDLRKHKTIDYRYLNQLLNEENSNNLSLSRPINGKNKRKA
jgi:hypothetical protein